MAENIVVKITSDASSLKETNQVLIETQKVSAGVVKEYENIQKATTKADASFKSLKTQIKEATTEATVLAQKFGENSVQANKAAQRVANLREEMSDFNDRVKALNPEAKFTAFNQVLGSTIGAVQGVTGAIQLFGGTSKEAEEIAKKLQGALNLTMGINSVLSMGDALKNLRLLLTASTVATEAQIVATEGATVATAELNVVMNANTIGVIVTVVLLLAAAWHEVESSLNESAAAAERLKNKWKDLDAARKTFDTTYTDKLKEQLDLLDFQIAKAEALGKSERDIIGLKMLRIKAELEANRVAISGGKGTTDQTDKLIAKNKELIQQLEILTIKFKNAKEVTHEMFDDIKLATKLGFDTDAIKKDIESFNEDHKDGLDGTMIMLPVSTIPLDIDKMNKDIADINRMIFMEQAPEILNAWGSVMGSIGEINRNQTDERIAQLEEQKNKGIISEEQYQKKVRDIKRKEAQEEKEIALFQAALQIALSILKASPDPLKIGLATAIGGFQLAAIASRPLPKFNQGKLPQFAGTYTGNDNQLAWVASEEAIIPARTTRAYYPTLSALYKKLISPDELNGFVRDRLNGKKQSDNVDISMLVSSMKGNKKVTLSNADYLANRIGQAIQNNYDPRKN